jgi:hypothetical protein
MGTNRGQQRSSPNSAPTGLRASVMPSLKTTRTSRSIRELEHEADLSESSSAPGLRIGTRARTQFARESSGLGEAEQDLLLRRGKKALPLADLDRVDVAPVLVDQVLAHKGRGQVSSPDHEIPTGPELQLFDLCPPRPGRSQTRVKRITPMLRVSAVKSLRLWKGHEAGPVTA